MEWGKRKGKNDAFAVPFTIVPSPENTRKTTQISLVKGEVCPDFALM
jgi:hypothetical protein